MTALAFQVYGTPRPGGSKRPFRNKHTGRIALVESGKHTPEWRADVRAAAEAAMQANGVPLMAGPLRLRAVFKLARPKGHYRKSGEVKPGAPDHPATKPDTTKLLRALEDALNGLVWLDDAQIVSQCAEKQYTTGRPGAIVEVMTA